MAKTTIFIPVLLLALYVHEGESVRCWTCSSDLHPNCNDPFLGRQTENPYLYRLENCDANTGVSFPYLASSKSVCKKQKKYVNGELVVTRGCTWKRSDDYTTTCPSSSNGANEVTYFCETCEYDGCNGASALGKAIAVILAPFALLLFK